MAGLLLVVLLSLSGVRPASAQTADTLEPNATIHVTVADEPDLSGDQTVDSNGNITMLYVNTVHVGGLTVEEARDTITAALAKYIKSPQVLVTLVSQGGILVEVDGAVQSQGPRVVRADTHLYDVLSQAQPNPDANLGRIQIVHGLPNEAHTTDVYNYLSYLQDKDAAGNPLLLNGDVITVFQKQVAITVTMRGSIVKPGQLSVSNTTTVLDAIQAAGGLTADANRDAVQVQHQGDVNGTPFNYDAAGQTPGDTTVNPTLQDGDTIIVDALETTPMFTIAGAVLRPAAYPLTPNETLADAIGIAGGAAQGAKLSKTTIVRKDPVTDKTTILDINAKDLTVQADTRLQTGDNITVPAGGPAPAPMNGITTIATVVGIIAGILLLSSK
jgi:protein involved in polysaccharide export with SLBB domain